MKNPISYNGALFMAGGFAGALFLAGAAHAITDTMFKYSTAQIGYLNVSPLAFVPEENDFTYVIQTDFMSPNTGGVSTCLGASVNLPMNARIKTLTVWGSSDRSSGVSAQLVRFNPATGAFDILASILSTDATKTRVAMSQHISDATAGKVDNLNFNYAIDTCLDHDQSRIYGARITYSYTTAGD